MYLGISTTETPRHLKGLMDEFRIWNRAKSLKQILEDTNRAVHPNSDGLFQYFDFNDSPINPSNLVTNRRLPHFPIVVQQSLDSQFGPETTVEVKLDESSTTITD